VVTSYASVSRTRFQKYIGFARHSSVAKAYYLIAASVDNHYLVVMQWPRLGRDNVVASYASVSRPIFKNTFLLCGNSSVGRAHYLVTIVIAKVAVATTWLPVTHLFPAPGFKNTFLLCGNSSVGRAHYLVTIVIAKVAVATTWSPVTHLFPAPIFKNTFDLPGIAQWLKRIPYCRMIAKVAVATTWLPVTHLFPAPGFKNTLDLPGNS